MYPTSLLHIYVQTQVFIDLLYKIFSMYRHMRIDFRIRSWYQMTLGIFSFNNYSYVTITLCCWDSSTAVDYTYVPEEKEPSILR